jgi:putative transposase
VHPNHPGYPALRRGRWSSTGADYFLTLCLRRPSESFNLPNLQKSGLEKLLQMEAQGIWSLRCAVFMPDHLHLLIRLAEARSLAAAVRQFKGPLSVNLRQSGAAWQPGFYDHRLRDDEDTLPVFRYLFLNPYRAGLCAPEEKWPGYYCAPEDWMWFRELTNEAHPEPEWLR